VKDEPTAMTFSPTLCWTVFACLDTPMYMEQKRAAALKANMAKRKAQARARKATGSNKEA